MKSVTDKITPTALVKKNTKVVTKSIISVLFTNFNLIFFEITYKLRVKQNKYFDFYNKLTNKLQICCYLSNK